MSGSTSGGSLLETLTIALSQCEDQSRMLEERDQTIIRLQHENDRLQQELNNERADTDRTQSDEFNAQQLQQLLEKNIEKQYEIDRLKRKLHLIKVKTQQRGLRDAFSSSPVVTPVAATDQAKDLEKADTDLRSDARHEQPRERKFQQDNSPNVPAKKASPPTRKRLRSQSPQPLTEKAANIGGASVKQPSSKRKPVQDKTVALIPYFTEDGDDHVHEQQSLGDGDRTQDKVPRTYNRLNALLAGPAPTTPLLPRPGKIHSPIARPSTDPTNSHAAQIPLPTDPGASPTRQRNKRASADASLFRRSSEAGPEDEEPFRVRPLHRLNQSHFKLNPAFNDGLDYAYNEVVRGREARKCLPGCTRPECCGDKFRAVAATLPAITGLQKVSDDDLLRDYLGPGSEDTILTLTKSARENLLHDARTKLIADKFGKMHRNARERPRSPSGFWATDMPGSQDHARNREIGRLRQREEVERRYNEALKENGRWIFADE